MVKLMYRVGVRISVLLEIIRPLISKYKGDNLNYVRLILKRFLTLFVQVPFPEFSKINMHVESYTIYNIVCFSESCKFVDR